MKSYITANRAWLYCRRPLFGMQHEERELLDNQEQRLLDYCMHLLTHAHKLADNGIVICTLPIQGPEQDTGMEMERLAQ